MSTSKQELSRATARLTVAGVVAAVLSASSAVQGTVPTPPADAARESCARGPALVLGDGRGTPFILKRSDSICGIDEPRAVSNPAKVDFAALLAATPEMRKLKRKRIRPESAEGTQLMAEARRRVRVVCEALCSAGGHCGVWKKIKRRDGRPVTDLTAKAKAAIRSGTRASTLGSTGAQDPTGTPIQSA